MFKLLHKRNNEKASSTLEYIVVVTAIVALLVIFLRPSGAMSQALNKSYSTVTNGMVDMSARLQQGISPMAGQEPAGEAEPAFAAGPAEWW